MTILVAVPDDDMRDRLAQQVHADVSIVTWRPGDAPLDSVIDLLVVPYLTSFDYLADLDGRTRHIQSQSLGFDGAEQFLPSGISFSNAIGVHEGPTAEMAMTLVLASQRGWPEIGRNQDAQKWDRPMWPGLLGQRVLLVGVGGIGSEFENRIDGFGVHLTRVARTAREGVHGLDELADLLPNADIVVLAIPLNAETTGFVDAAFLDRMPHGALLVNVSRGAIVDTDALVEHVRSGAIRSALDVVDPEPLPAGHPLWSLPGSLLSPHLGGAVASIHDRVDPLVLRQIARLVRGELPDHIVIN